MKNNLTVMTRPHKDILTYLENRGVELIEECPFPPYNIDLFLPDFHAGIEIDGPQHEKKRDEERDEELLKVYELPIFRIKAEHVKFLERWEEELKTFLEVCKVTADERWEICKPRTPWL
ncbi:MAG TPA: hypothetical protein ENI23_04150 [bacterium]|nr:hypothetical protein [bacterium]